MHCHWVEEVTMVTCREPVCMLDPHCLFAKTSDIRKWVKEVDIEADIDCMLELLCHP